MLAAAHAGTEAVTAHAPATAPAIGVDLQRVRAAFLRVQSVEAVATGLRVQDGEFTGGIDLGRIRAGVDGAFRDPSGR